MGAFHTPPAHSDIADDQRADGQCAEYQGNQRDGGRTSRMAKCGRGRRYISPNDARLKGSSGSLPGGNEVATNAAP